ncbi:MAG: hypothetical protein P9L99_16080 [Candidatus Lernaella stagnicola]|nr:hypothetical protein [Candidatus Lernaella stagnicola]
MAQCSQCGDDAHWKIVKRLNFVPVKPFFLCDEHRQEMERKEFTFIIAGLVISLVIVLISLAPWRFLSKQESIAPTPIQAEMVVADLDRDGRVSWFEQQAVASDEVMANFKQFKYPFARVLTPDSPTRPIKKKIALDAFLNASQTSGTAGGSLVNRFNHPLLFDRFVQRHTDPTAQLQIRALYLTHDPYLAIVLAKPDTEEPSFICLERLSPDQEQAVDALESPADKN